jgi:hypothetical protein
MIAPAKTTYPSSMRFSAKGCQNRAKNNATIAIHFISFVIIEKPPFLDKTAPSANFRQPPLL